MCPMQDELDVIRERLKGIPDKTQDELARELKVSASWLNKFLRGETACSNPRFSTLKRMQRYTEGQLRSERAA